MSSKINHLKEKISTKLSCLNEMQQVEELIQQRLGCEASRLTEIADYLLSLGGKRMRPALNLLVGRMLGAEPTAKRSLIEISAGIELIHMATLLHDDIIDNSGLRRHKESPFKKFGLADSLLCGDFLLTRAFSLCAHLDPYIIEATERACVFLTEGEILEIPLYKKEHSLDSSLAIARKKTAALFALAGETAGFICELEDSYVKSLYNFGENLGVAFQIVDDILDVISTRELLGKEPGIDIRERKPSIINVLWLESGDPLSKKLLRKPETGTEDQFVVDALKQIVSGDTVSRAKKMAEEKMKQASTSLEILRANNLIRDNSAYETIMLIMDYVLKRLE